MNEQQIFTFEQNEVRTVIINDEPFFIGKDVAEVLGYSNTSKAVSTHVDDEDKRFTMIAHSQNGNLSEARTTIINESGLYSLILKSKLPKAKKFKRWVTSEVLPAIRKHGLYATEELVNNPDLFLEVLSNFKKERQLTTTLKTELIEQKPIVDYYHEILQSKDTMTITQIASDYGMSGIAMNQLLNKLRVQRKVNGQWVLYRDLMKKDLTRSETTIVQNGKKTVVTTKWTQKGRLFLYDLLKKEKILPLRDG